MSLEHTQPYATLNNGVTMPLLGLGVYDVFGLANLP